MQLFYTPALEPGTPEIRFDKAESKHMVKVLRKTEGDTLHSTNGKGDLFTLRITDADPNHCKAVVLQSEHRHGNRNTLHMAVAPTKNSARYEWFLEKATEIGVDEITPILCERSERKVVNTGRLEKVLEAAMKQSLRLYLPRLNPPLVLEAFLRKEHKGQRFIAHCVENDRTELKRRLGADRDITILIGPEGDFSHEEIRLALESGFDAVSLGETRLRTETAAIVACTTVAIINRG